jgi:dTDP-glucose 4,6-dehydratase
VSAARTTRPHAGASIITGGAGFIGSALVRALLAAGETVANIDSLTYAGCRESLADVEAVPGYTFHHADIRDAATVREIFELQRPRCVFHLAAESHVDRSIDGPDAFVDTNVVGTFRMLQEARRYRDSLDERERAAFRFIHVSTDEVFGALGDDDRPFDTETPYAPRSPYSASKAAADHLARAWFHTFDLPVIVTNCSNNYGPRQFPEKLIPLVILRALRGQPLPVYGDGSNVRDWIYVEDHVAGLIAAASRGVPGETYLFGGDAERRNIDVVRSICGILDQQRPDGAPHDRLIEFVPDRPGHDFRYAINSTYARNRLGWTQAVGFEDGLRRTVEWYLENTRWLESVRAARYQGQRLGLAASSGGEVAP